MLRTFQLNYILKKLAVHFSVRLFLFGNGVYFYFNIKPSYIEIIELVIDKKFENKYFFSVFSPSRLCERDLLLETRRDRNGWTRPELRGRPESFGLAAGLGRCQSRSGKRSSGKCNPDFQPATFRVSILGLNKYFGLKVFFVTCKFFDILSYVRLILIKLNFVKFLSFFLI